MSNTENKTASLLATDFIKPESCVFFATENGFIGARINGEEYKRVTLSRALPLTTPDEYICVFDMEQKELAVIRSKGEFSADQQSLIDKELSARYFCPVIDEIVSVKEKMGHFYFEVLIGTFKKSFAVKDVSKNIRSVGDFVDIVDVDGNRYRIVDFNRISTKSRRKIEPYLY